MENEVEGEAEEGEGEEGVVDESGCFAPNQVEHFVGT